MAEFIFNWTPTAKFIQKLIKDKLIEKELVKTGKLLDSIEVISNGEGEFSVIAEDYFKYLDSKYNISNEVFESQELVDFIEKEMARQIDNYLI